MFWMIPLVGAAAGALMNKKNPLAGAAMGGLAGLTGGAALGALAPAAAGTAGATGGLLGAGGATAGIGGATQGAAQGAASGLLSGGGIAAEQAAAPIIEKGVSAGLFDTLNVGSGGMLDKGMTMANNAGKAMQTAQMFQQPEKELPPPSPVTVGQGMGPQSLTQLYQQGQQYAQSQQADDWRRREAQKQRIARMGMPYYG